MKKGVDFWKSFGIIVFVREDNTNAEWCNGSTADSDSVSRGSSPFSVVPWQGRRMFLHSVI